MPSPANNKGQRMLLAYRCNPETNTYPVRIDNVAYPLLLLNKGGATL